MEAADDEAGLRPGRGRHRRRRRRSSGHLGRQGAAPLRARRAAQPGQRASRRDGDRRPARDAARPGRALHRAPAPAPGAEAGDHRLVPDPRPRRHPLGGADRAGRLVRRAPLARPRPQDHRADPARAGARRPASPPRPVRGRRRGLRRCARRPSGSAPWAGGGSVTNGARSLTAEVQARGRGRRPPLVQQPRRDREPARAPRRVQRRRRAGLGRAGDGRAPARTASGRSSSRGSTRRSATRRSTASAARRPPSWARSWPTSGSRARASAARPSA